jgi:S-(hydroxymethyl)mycothiol dehydrogenase
MVEHVIVLKRAGAGADRRVRHGRRRRGGRTPADLPAGLLHARDLAGTVVLVGVPTPDTTIELPLIEVFGRSGALKSSWYGDCLPSRDFPMLIDLHLQGRLPLEKFVTETIGLDDVEGAFHRMEGGEVLRSVVTL